MNLKPGEMTCRIVIGYMQSGRGPLGEPLPEKLVETGKAWAKDELVSGRKVRTLDQQQVVETRHFYRPSRGSGRPRLENHDEKFGLYRPEYRPQNGPDHYHGGGRRAA